ncbi:MAG: hypothetical protein PHD15_06870 [Clostridia bacterium]|nr:hypothetical protein [Clostridia bacterium]
MKKNGCDFGFCSICPVEKCDIRKMNYEFEIRCNGNCYLCDRALHYRTVGEGTPFQGKFSVCNIYHCQHHHDFKFYARVGKRDYNSKIEKEIYQYLKCQDCTFEEDIEDLKKIIKTQEEKGWFQNIDDGKLMESLKMTVTKLQDFRKEKNCPVAIGILNLVTNEGITEEKMVTLLKKQYKLPKCFFCSVRSLRYLLNFFESKKIIFKNDDIWYKI